MRQTYRWTVCPGPTTQRCWAGTNRAWGGGGVFAYDLGRKYRIICRVNWNREEIEFLRVCDHKSVYGKD